MGTLRKVNENLEQYWYGLQRDTERKRCITWPQFVGNKKINDDDDYYYSYYYELQFDVQVERYFIGCRLIESNIYYQLSCCLSMHFGACCIV